MTKQYGFYTESYDNGVEIETLMTGDGKAQFIDIKHADGTAGIGIAYGIGTGIGTTTEYNKLVDSDMQIKWQVKFDNQKSVDAMITALLDVKSHLAA